MAIVSSPAFTALNFGEISPKLRGRADKSFYNQALDYLQNYKVTAQGEIQFREGSVYVANTRDNNPARLIPFEFNVEQSYIIEISEGYMRFYKDNGLITDAPQDITNITQASPAVLTYSGSDTFANGDRVFLSGVVGMHQVNNREFIVANVDTGANTFELQDVDSNNIDSTGYGAYSSGGSVAEIVEISSPYQEEELFELNFSQTNDTMYIVHPNYAPRKLTRSSHTVWTLGTFSRTADPFTGSGDYPSAITLFEGRIIYASTDNEPTALWFSKGNDIDNFTTGTAVDDAVKFTIRSDQANRIRWIIGAEEYMVAGTSGGEFRISGGGDNNSITPTNISIKPTSFNGSSKTRPIRLDSYILYVQRNGRTVRSFEYSALQAGYTSPDRTLLADHIGKSGFKEFSYTAGTPNILWGVRNDGKMMGLTFDPTQEVIAWHPHATPGSFESVASIPEDDADEELWVVVKRTINGQTQRYVEYFPNVPDLPIEEDYFTGEDNTDSDYLTYLSALWNTQKTLIHSDASLVFDGRDSTTGIDLTVTGDITTGSTVTLTASGAFFTADMATDKRRIQCPNGGQVEINTFNSSTEIEGVVLYELCGSFFTGGTWAYMARGLGSLWHMEGEEVAILSDGGVIGGKSVSNGEVVFDEDTGYAIVGLIYKGVGKTQDITGASQQGLGQGKIKSMTSLAVRFRDSLGTKFGTSLYSLEHFAYRETGEVSGRPPRLVSDIVQIEIDDVAPALQKNLYWLHDTPTPSNIQFLQPLLITDDR